MYQSDGNHTHYLYYSGPNGLREPTGLLCLAHAGRSTRKKIIHAALKNGELLAKLPGCVKDMKSLRKLLEGSGR